LSYHHTTLPEGLACVIIKCCYFSCVCFRHGLQLWRRLVWVQAYALPLE
jgi:hypothetical protein